MASAHGPIACLALALFAILLTPVTLTRIAWLGPHALLGSRRRTSNGKVALVTGGRAQKAIYVTRALARQRYRVILAEERGWGDVCAARFSNSVSRFHRLPSDAGRPYVEALLRIVQQESIDLFVPCSGVGTGIEEAEAACMMRKGECGGKAVQTVIQDAELLETLHEKDRFIDLVHELQLDAPLGHLVKTPEEAMALLHDHQHGQARFLFKAATMPDDVGRADMTTYPLLTMAVGSSTAPQIDWTATETRLRRGLHIPLTPDTPYLAQEFIGGRGASEWCTHATVIDGEVTAFVCCPSNDMLMTYHNATHTDLGRRGLLWTRTFLARLGEHPRWQTARLTGHFSFDFIHQPSSDRLVVIECNPRVHTAICLLQDDIRLGAALDGSLRSLTSSERLPIMPDLTAETISWLGHDIVARWSRTLVGSLLGLRTKVSASKKAALRYDLGACGRDGAWIRDDPLAYLAFYHLQWPVLLLRQAFVRQRPFSRINVSTARIFECS